jgi:hypothetical protein
MSTASKHRVPLLFLLAFAGGLLAVLPAAAQLVPAGPLVEVGSIGPGYTNAELQSLTLQQPRVLMEPDGGFIALWWQADKRLVQPRLMIRRFDAAGEPLWVPQEFWDPVDGVGDVRGLDDAAMNAAGDFVVAWNEPGAGIFFRTFDVCRFPLGPIVAIGDGKPTLPHEVQSIQDLAVGLGPDGTVVVAWVQRVVAPETEGGETFDEVIVERYDAGGELIGELTRLHAGAVIVDVDVEVAADGGFGVAFEGITIDPAASYVDFEMFDAEGEPLVVPPVGQAHSSVEAPQVAADGSGSFLVALRDSGGQGPDGLDGSCTGIFARLHDGNGTPTTEEIQVNAVAAGCQFAARAEGLGDGWMVAWAGAEADDFFGVDAADSGIWIREVAADGSLAGEPIRVLPGWVPTYELAAGDGRAALGAIVARGPKDPPRFVVQRLAPPALAACAHAGADDHLCLQAERFRVDADWRDPYNVAVGLGSGFHVADVSDSGAFWFFGEDNLELLVKVLDGRGVNGHFWVFYGAMTTVEYWVAVTDLATGEQEVYYNPPRVQASVADTAAFAAPAGGAATVAAAPQVLAGSPSGGVIAVPAGDLTGRAVAAATGPCPEDEPTPGAVSPNVLCLQGSFEVEVSWSNPRTGGSGLGRPVAMTPDTGGFWFFDEDNVELVVKVLDGRPVNGYWWVFYAGLSDVEYDLVVTPPDGNSVVYTNPPFQLNSGADTAAVPE